jgi:CRP-like cAMP-binding protein
MALIDLNPRSASVVAVEDCIALEISHQALYVLYENYLEQFVLIQMNLAREVSRRLRALDERLSRLDTELLRLVNFRRRRFIASIALLGNTPMGKLPIPIRC